MLELEEIDPSDDDLVATEIAERHAVIDRLHGEILGLTPDGGHPGCDSLTWPRVDGLKWLHLCGRGCAVLTV